MGPRRIKCKNCKNLSRSLFCQKKTSNCNTSWW